jgi:hypothetical protein
VLKWYLRLAAALQFCLWGVTHVFFPAWYLSNIAGKDPSLLTPQNLLVTQEIGVSAIALSLATFIAAAQPVRHYPVILMNYVIGLGSVAVTLNHILVRHASEEWGHVATVLLLLAILTVLYPWKQLATEIGIVKAARRAG